MEARTVAMGWRKVGHPSCSVVGGSVMIVHAQHMHHQTLTADAGVQVRRVAEQHRFRLGPVVPGRTTRYTAWLSCRT